MRAFQEYSSVIQCSYIPLELLHLKALLTPVGSFRDQHSYESHNVAGRGFSSKKKKKKKKNRHGNSDLEWKVHIKFRSLSTR